MVEKNEIVEKYVELNNSFKKTLVFHLGIDAGFFSEYNSMIYMILYCLENKIQFKLYSDDANFAYKDGWQDYFEPFCDEVHEKFHSRYNMHPAYTSYSRAFKMLVEKRDSSLLRWRIKSDLLIGFSKWIQFWNKNNVFDYYTHDLLDKIETKNKHYSVPELGISGNYIHAYNILFDLTWRFNNSVLDEVNTIIHDLKLPDEYIACQIRGGDKIIEYDLLSVDLYIRKIKEISTLRDAFVLTDDFRIITQLRELAPEFRWYTLCQEKEKGYYNSSFAKTESKLKQEQMIRFFASIQIMESATTFLGTITATPSIVIGMRKYQEGHWVDFEKDYFFNSIDLTIAEKKVLSEKYLSEK